MGDGKTCQYGYVKQYSSSSGVVLDEFAKAKQFTTLEKAREYIGAIIDKCKVSGKPRYTIHDFSVDWEQWELKYVDDEGNSNIHVFGRGEIKSAKSDGKPPYYVEIGGKKWFLEQERLVQSGTTQSTMPTNSDQFVYERGGAKDVEYSVPTIGLFVRAYRATLVPERYADYLYIDNGGLSFKVSEESESFVDAMTKVPPFYADEVTRNKLGDLNNVQTLVDYSTFIHQSEDPDKVKGCGSFNPLFIDAVLKYGLEERDTNSKDLQGQIIQTESGKDILLDNFSEKTRLRLQLEDGEIDEYLKIYTNYVRVDDGHGDWHYDLYFNVQNLLNSPFEYISSVTNQPNVLIIPDSYLYLTGDKFVDKGDHNEIDEKKMDKLKEGGELAIYGQVKTYSGDQLSDVSTLKLFTYRVYNVSDDKPKFLIEKVYDITKTALTSNVENTIRIEFQNVMWTVDEDMFEYVDDSFAKSQERQFQKLFQDVTVVQPVKIWYNWNRGDDYRINSISFDLVNDVIDFEHTPRLCDYWEQSRTLRDGEQNGIPYYDRWSDNCMSLSVDENTGVPRLTLNYSADCGYNFETIYLKWKLPVGFNVMDTIDRLQGYVFSSTAYNVTVDSNNSFATPVLDIVKGYVTTRVKKIGRMYLGLEHSTTKRKHGFVLTNLKNAILNAIGEGNRNSTIYNAIPEDEMVFRANIASDETFGLPAPDFDNNEK